MCLVVSYGMLGHMQRHVIRAANLTRLNCLGSTNDMELLDKCLPLFLRLSFVKHVEI